MIEVYGNRRKEWVEGVGRGVVEYKEYKE